MFKVSRAWARWRKSVYNRDNRRCVLCGRKNKRMAPHHILPKRDYPKLRYVVSNGATLCWKCHKKTIGNEHRFIDRIVKKLFGSMKKWKLTKHYRKHKMQRRRVSGFKKR